MLQSRQRLSGPELAARLEVNTRTVRRYITMLQDLGFPIEAERGRHGFYHLRPGFKLPPLMFTEEEALALTLGLLAVRRLGLTVAAPAVEGALAKIERVLPQILQERVRAVQETLTSPSSYNVNTKSETLLTLCSAAQMERRVFLELPDMGREKRASARPISTAWSIAAAIGIAWATAICARICASSGWTASTLLRCATRPSHVRSISIASITSCAP